MLYYIFVKLLSRLRSLFIILPRGQFTAVITVKMTVFTVKLNKAIIDLIEYRQEINHQQCDR